MPIIGAMDLIEEDESQTLIITDFKTSSKAYSVGEVDNNFQMLIYYMAARANGYADREIILKFDTLIKTKKPKFEQYFTVRSEIDEIRAIRKIQAVWNGIKNNVFVPNDTSWKCKNCSYRKACDEWFLKEVSHDKKGDFNHVQDYLTVLSEDRCYQIVNVELLLRRHPPEAVIAFLEQLRSEYQKELGQLIKN